MSDKEDKSDSEDEYVPPPKPKTETFTLDDLKIWYEKWGESYEIAKNDKHKILVISGDMAHANTLFAKLTVGVDPKQFIMVFWDPPGFGKARPNEYNFLPGYIQEYARMALILMKYHLKWENFTVAAFSDGGLIGLQMAADFPDDVKKLFLWNSLAKIDDPAKFAAKLENEKKNWSPERKKEMEEIYGDDLEPFWADYTKNLCAFEGIKDEDFAKIMCPTVIVAGENDKFIDPSNSKYIQSKIKGSELHIIKGGGHNLHDEKTDEVSKLLMDLVLKQ